MSSFYFFSSFSIPPPPNICPEALLACILVIPAAIALALVSILYKNEDEAVDQPPEDLPRLPMSRYEHIEISIPCGLEEVLIDMIPVAKFTWLNIPTENQACVVCLCPFEEDESIKVLPECNHSFHAACIDKWFESHSTCPICRRKITLDTIETQQAQFQQKAEILPPVLCQNNTQNNNNLNSGGITEDFQSTAEF